MTPHRTRPQPQLRRRRPGPGRVHTLAASVSALVLATCAVACSSDSDSGKDDDSAPGASSSRTSSATSPSASAGSPTGSATAPTASPSAAPSASAPPTDAPGAAVFAVRGVMDEAVEQVHDEGNVLGTAPDSGVTLELGPAVIGSEQVESAAPLRTEDGQWVVVVTLDDSGTAAMESLSAAAACRDEAAPHGRIAFLVGGVVVTDPEVSLPCGTRLGGTVQVTGDFTQDEAARIAGSLTGR